jgi:hypothetical protein
MWTTFAVLAVAAGVGVAFACSDHSAKTTAAASGARAVVATAGAKGTCTADMAQRCTAEMAAACQMHGTTAAAECPHLRGAAAGKECPYHQGAATAGHSGCDAKGVTATAACASGRAKDVAMSGCCAPGAAKTAAATSAPGRAGRAASSYASEGACAGAKSESEATALAAGASCGGHGASTKTTAAAADCDYCESVAACQEELKAAGATTQIIKLKNGVAFLYTASAPGGASAVQAAMAHRGERDAQIARSGAKAKVCGECKSVHQAMAAGKISREVVKIEGGAMAIVTSTDPAIVAKFHRWVDETASEHASTAKAVKS